jgi:protein-tyrosine phosphatase
VRWRMLYRADSLHRLTDDDLEVVARLGLRTVIDLRAGDEVDLHPDRLPDDSAIERHHLPMFDPAAVAQSAGVIDRLRAGDVADLGSEILMPLYLDTLEQYATSFGQVITHAATAERLPLLFHCAGGKDRTGLAAALTLSVLGVSDQDIVADYAVTAERLRTQTEQWRPVLREQGLSEEAIDALLGPQPGAMAATLEGIRGRWGGIEAFLAGPGQADPATFGLLRGLVLEDDDPLTI